MLLDTVRSVVRLHAPEMDGNKRRVDRAVSVNDLRTISRRRLPRGVFDYIDGGAEDERTMRSNVDAFGRYTFSPRVLRGVGNVDTSSTLLGKPLPIPLVLAPTGFTRMVHPEGELAVARAAARAGLPYCLSTMATRSIEEIADVSTGPKWFQVYVWRDRGLVHDMLDRASERGYEAIVLTVDTAVLGRRERDVRRGFTLPPRIGAATILDGLVHPAWTAGLLRSAPIVFANVANDAVQEGSDPVDLADYINSQFDPELCWDDLDWFRERWAGPIILKGVQSVDDAIRAADSGIDVVAISNHGGRQLDDAPASADLIAPIADVVGGRCPIICDGGVRRGSDIVKALALGANACMIGRPYLYALGAAGERGVDHVLRLFSDGMGRTMALAGIRTVDEIGPEILLPRYRG